VATLTVPAPAGGTTDDQTTLANVWAAAASGDVINFPTNAIYRKSGKLTMSGKNVVINGNGSTINSTNPASCAISWTNGAVANCNNLKHIILGASTRINLANDVAGFVVNASAIGDLRDLLSRGSAGLGYYFWNAQGAGKSVTNMQRIVSDTTLADGIHFTNGTGGFTATDCQSLDAGDDGFAHIGYLQDGAEAGRPHDIDLVRPYVKDSRARGISYAGAKDCNTYDPNVDGSLAASVYFAVERGDFNTGQTTNCHVYRGRLSRPGTSYAAIPNGTNGTALDQGHVLFLASGADAVTSNCSIEDSNVGNTGSVNYNVVRAIVYNGGVLTNDSAQRINCYSGSPTTFVGGNTVASISPATSNDYRSTALPAYSSTGNVAVERSDSYAVASNGSSSAGGVLVDRFNRTNASSAGVADTGQTWGTNVGTWGTDGSTLGSVSKADGNQISIETGTKVQDVEAKLVAGASTTNAYPALLINWEATGTYYRVEMEPNGAAGINRGINSSFTNFSPKAPAGTVTNGKTVRLKSEIGASSTLLTLYVDGVQVAQVTDAWASAGRPAPIGTRVGFRHGAGAGGISIQWDDLIVNKVTSSPVVALRSETYDVKSAMFNAYTAMWSVRRPVSATVSDTYAVRATVTSSRSETYAVKSTLAVSQADTYGVRTAAANTGADSYAVRMSLLTSTGTTWDVSAPGVVASRSDAYVVRSTVQSSASDTFAVRSGLLATRADTYPVRSIVAAPVADAYAVRSFSVSQSSDAYGVRTGLSSTVAETFPVRSVMASSASETYGVRTTVLDAESSTWAVRSAVVAQAADAYSVRARVTETRSDTTVVRSSVVSERADVYGIVSIANLEVQNSDAYSVRVVVASAVADDYGVRYALAPVTVQERYYARKFVALSRTNTSPVRALVESSRTDTFTTTGRVIVEQTDTFTTTGALRVDVSDAFSVSAPVTVQASDAYAVRVAVAGASTDAYGVRLQASKVVADDYAVRAVLTVRRADSYGVRTQLAKSTADAYAVRVRLSASRSDTYAMAGTGAANIVDDAWSVAEAVVAQRSDRYSAVGVVLVSRTDAWRVFGPGPVVSRSDRYSLARNRLAVRVRAAIAGSKVRATVRDNKIRTG